MKTKFVLFSAFTFIFKFILRFICMHNPKGLKIIGRRGDWLSNKIVDKKWDSIKFKCGMIYTDMCVLSIKRLFLDAQDAFVLLIIHSYIPYILWFRNHRSTESKNLHFLLNYFHLIQCKIFHWENCISLKNVWYIFVCLGTISFLRLNATEYYGYALCWIKCNKENGLYDKIFLVNVSLGTSIFIQKHEMIAIRLKNHTIPL